MSYFQPPLIPLVTLGSLGYASSEQESVVFKNIYTIVELFTAISNSHATSDDILNLFDKFKISQKKIDMYPEGVRVPLLEIADFIWNNSHIANGSIPVRSFFAEDMSSTISSNTKDIRSVLQTIGEDTNNLWDGQSESNRIAISRQIFSADRRFYEVSRLLQTSRVQSASLVQSPDLNEHEWMMMQQEIFKATAKRTMSIPFGRAALFFSSRKPLITETYPIPKINFDVSIKPSNIKLSFQRSVLSDESIGWGYFHNGVSAGLSVSRDSSHINGSWVLFNKPANLNSQYSGFLLGLGLNGLLKDLEEYHMYNLLGPKHSYTSIALLLGMTASKLGTKDTKLTKVLSVHVNALLPVGASDLQVSPLVQCAGVIGIGLLYCSTAQRRMSELLVSEILRSRPEMIHSEYDETYRLSAGISFGLINLGKGNSFTSLIDIETIDKLLQLSISAKDIVQGRQKSYDTEPAVCGALFALTLTFLKTNNYEIANKLELPDSELKLSYYRPDSLYLRMLASCLIKWEEIGNTISWVESHIPNVLRMHGPITDMNRLDSDHMVYLNVIAALCTSIGLRYSSTADEHAKSCILYYLDNFMRLAELPVTNYDQTMTKTSINSNIATISFALSTVMVGTGDLDCLRRLRRLYGRNTKDTTFGSHLANQLSLGILFMGGGQYAFNNSDITLAGLLIAFYPLLPSRMKDNISHLQVLRHFWCLGCEPKCVVVRDQNTNEVLPVQVQIRLKNGTEFVQDSPCLLRCEIDDIAKVCIDDSRYFMVELFMDNESDNRLFKDKLLMFIKKKRGDLMRMGNLFELAIDVEEDTKSKGGTAITQFKNVKSFANLDKFRLGSIQSLDGKCVVFDFLFVSVFKSISWL